MWKILRNTLIGHPLPSDEASKHRLGNLSALAVFASDALSSVAYATEEILLVLILAGPFYLYLSLPISGAIVLLLFIIATSYRQTIRAYPTGGGAYTVAKENLGTLMGLIAGASLLIDYVLTVAVSVAAGIAAITSAVPSLYEHRVALALAGVGVIATGNLRGVKESGHLFAGPAYGFILAMGLLIIVGFFRYLTGDPPSPHLTPQVFEPLSAFLILRAFSSGCAALTGVEAISNGVTAFQKPEAENANRVLRWLAMILACLFGGITFLSWLYRIVPDEKETAISQLARVILGDGISYGFVQMATCAILILAANTSFADFPRLASRMARDSFLPRQLQQLGDRLVFSNGIWLLAGAASFLLVLFSAKTHLLIPLYAVGVFLSFTLSQTGMVVHHLKVKEPFWQKNLLINLLGATITAVVLIVILVAKFTHGAWIVTILIPLFVAWFYAVRDHYVVAAQQLTIDMAVPPRKLKHTVIVPVVSIHRGVLSALEYAKSLSSNVRAVTVALDEATAKSLQAQWRKWASDVPLVVLRTPYRSLVEPLKQYIKEVDAQDPEDLITVVIPSFVPAKWWHNFLHNQSSMLLGAAFRGMRNVVVTSVRFHFDR